MGTEVHIRAVGRGAQSAFSAIHKLIDNKFGDE
jgi:phosphotransferase system HPr-like phosphotransfer protein